MRLDIPFRALALALLVCILALPAEAYRRGERLDYGVVGEVTSQGLQNPTNLLAIDVVQDALLWLAAGPQPTDALAARLDDPAIGVGTLVDAGLVRRSGDRVAIDFPLFTAEDKATLLAIGADFGGRLADAIEAAMPAFDRALDDYDMAGIDRRALRYILIGCFSLDWDGLDLTEELGLRQAAPRRPDGDRYSLWAEERTSPDAIQGLYWGSHNAYFQDLVLTSFGDHAALPRDAFPDLVWRLDTAVDDRSVSERDDLREAIATAAALRFDSIARDAGAIMLALRTGGRTVAALAGETGRDPAALETDVAVLAALGYVAVEDGVVRARVPVLAAVDAPMVRAVLAEGRLVMTRWIEENAGRLRTRAAALTPLRSDVAFEQVFTQLWHHVFGAANKDLARRGLFIDPYAESAAFRGFLPVIWDRQVYDGGAS